MATTNQRSAAKRNVKKGQAGARRKQTLKNLPSSTRRELEAQARWLGIKGRSKMGKAELKRGVIEGRSEMSKDELIDALATTDPSGLDVTRPSGLASAA